MLGYRGRTMKRHPGHRNTTGASPRCLADKRPDRPHGGRRIVALNTPTCSEGGDNRQPPAAGLRGAGLARTRDSWAAAVRDGDFDAVVADSPGDRQLAVVKRASVPDR